MPFTRSDKRTPFSELERFQSLSWYERVLSESGARAKTGAVNEPKTLSQVRTFGLKIPTRVTYNSWPRTRPFDLT